MLRFFRSGLLATMFAACLSGSVSAETFDAYAPPNAWGAKHEVTAHLGAASYKISYSVTGDTVVVGEVEYYGEDGELKTVKFNGEITFRTGDVVAQPKVRFKGIPTGSALKVTVE